MNRSVLRYGLAAVAAFYVIVTGLFPQAYVPLARFDAQVEANTRSRSSSLSPQQVQDALNFPANEMKVRRYGSILLWGTVGLAVFGGVVVVTRRRKGGDTQ